MVTKRHIKHNCVVFFCAGRVMRKNGERGMIRERTPFFAWKVEFFRFGKAKNG